MRILGVILVFLGLLGLGYREFKSITESQRHAEPNAGKAIRADENTLQIPPVLGGIAVVSGLILLVSSTRKV
jgi:hypothetical protein